MHVAAIPMPDLWFAWNSMELLWCNQAEFGLADPYLGVVGAIAAAGQLHAYITTSSAGHRRSIWCHGASGFCLLSSLSAGVFLIAQDCHHTRPWMEDLGDRHRNSSMGILYTDWLFRNEEPCNWIGSSMMPCSRAQNACGAFGAWLEGFQFPVRAISLEGPPPCFRWRSACDSESQKWGWIRHCTALLFN